MRQALNCAAIWLLFPTLGAAQPVAGALAVRKLADSGALEIVDGDKPVLRYNYQLVPQPDPVKDRIAEGNRRYAVPRSDYIHPLYGLNGEVLTDDWVPDHPHHRGIYWAWPEVDWNGQRGDLHALQLVFARPTGKVQIEQSADFVQLEAENEWRWEDRTPIVRELTTIRAHRRTNQGRAIDLQFRFVALDKDVQVARRGQSHYGGLNVRLSPVRDQQITPVTDPAGTSVRQAWAQRTGTPNVGQGIVGLTILQHAQNPDYPGDWVQYPEIFWIQPTFPAAGTRYTISKQRPLELRFRLWIHDSRLEAPAVRALWSAYQAQ